MSQVLRYEAWTLPWDAAGFHRKIAKLPAIDGAGSVPFLTTQGNSSVDLANFERIATLISGTEGSLIRVFDGTDVIDEWIAKRNKVTIDDEQRIDRISGDTIRSVFDKILIRPQDGATPTTAGAWVWGGSNLVGNPGFEEGGYTSIQWELSIDATGGTYTLTDGTDTTLPIAFDAQAGTIATRLQTDIAAIDDVSVIGTSTSPYRRTIIAVNPQIGYTLSIGTGSLTGGSGTVEVSVEGESLYGPWESNRYSSLSGDSALDDRYDFFGIVTSPVDVGSQALGVNPPTIFPLSSRNPGIQQVRQVNPGGTYQWSIRINPALATDTFRIGVYGFPGDDQIALSASLSPTTGVYSTISISDVVIPADTTQVRLVVFWDNRTNTQYEPGLARFDTALFTEGFAADDVGAIATELATNGVASGILDWVDISSFAGATDSGGVAWPGNISLSVPWGSTFGQFLDQLVDLGYEWELVEKTPIGEIAAGNPTHDLNIYGPGGRDDDPEVGIAPKMGVTAGATVYRIPEFTRVLVEGADGLWTVVDDATTQADFGELEILSRQTNLATEATMILSGQQWLDFEAANRNAVEFNLAATSYHHHPLRDYRPGDTVAMQVPPTLARELRRVQRVDYSFANPTQYKVVGSRVLEGEAAAFDLVWRMWRRFQRERPEQASVGGSGGEGVGGDPAIFVAASNASNFSKALATPGFICNGLNDRDIIQEALNSLTQGGRVVLSEGTFNTDATIILGTFGSPGNPHHLHGMGRGITNIVCSNAAVDVIRALTGQITITKMSISGGLEGIDFNQSFCTVEDVEVENTASDGIVIATRGKVVDCYISGCTGDGIRASSDCRIIGNFITGVDDSGVVLTGNRNTVAENQIRSPGEHGIHVTGNDFNEIHDNLILNPGTGTDDSFDGIFLDGNATQTIVTDNTVTPADSGNQPRYGINNGPSTDGSIIYGNRLGDPVNYGTAPLIDQAGDALLTMPNHPTYGDNFTFAATQDFTGAGASASDGTGDLTVT